MQTKKHPVSFLWKVSFRGFLKGQEVVAQPKPKCTDGKLQVDCRPVSHAHRHSTGTFMHDTMRTASDSTRYGSD